MLSQKPTHMYCQVVAKNQTLCSWLFVKGPCLNNCNLLYRTIKRIEVNRLCKRIKKIRSIHYSCTELSFCPVNIAIASRKTMRVEVGRSLEPYRNLWCIIQISVGFPTNVVLRCLLCKSWRSHLRMNIMFPNFQNIRDI